jgi:predicted  nucleic acid-binding Zn-ribbon protein
MGNRNIRKAIRSLQERIREHQAKIIDEDSDSPLVVYWNGEIRVWEDRIQRLEDRLARRMHRGSRRRRKKR